MEMQAQVIRIAGRTPRVEGEIRGLVASGGFEERFDPDCELFAVIDSHGALQGIASAVEEGEDCLLQFVVVRDGARGGGIGSALVNHVLGFFSDRCKRAYTWGDRGRDFAKRFGFVEASQAELPGIVLRHRSGGEGGAGVPVLVLPLAGRWSKG